MALKKHEIETMSLINAENYRPGRFYLIRPFLGNYRNLYIAYKNNLVTGHGFVKIFSRFQA